MPPGTVLNTAAGRRFDLFLGFRVPEGDFPGFAGFVHIDDALVRRAAKAQGNVFEFIDECAVDEHVEQGHEFVRDLAAVAAAVFQHIGLQGGTGIAPDVLFGV